MTEFIQEIIKWLIISSTITIIISMLKSINNGIKNRRITEIHFKQYKRTGRKMDKARKKGLFFDGKNDYWKGRKKRKKRIETEHKVINKLIDYTANHNKPKLQ